MSATVGLGQEHLSGWRHDGYTVVRGFADPSTCRAHYEAAVGLSRREAQAADADLGIVLVPEGHPGANATEPEDFVAKIFKLHRREPFASFAHDPRLLAMVSQLLGSDVDLFLSQFIFKGPEAYGQPWHQDSYYFPFSESHQVGAWLAVTRATVRNGCLWVVPGSHEEHIYDHVPDDRPNATSSYTRIVDRDTSSAVSMEMAAGDLLLFDSHLLHSSTDNETEEVRAAFVCHYSRAGVTDRTPGGSSVNDWLPAIRDGRPILR